MSDISKAEEQMKKLDLMDEIDKTIKSVCGKIQGEVMLSGEYPDTVKALAALVEARATLD